MKKILKITALGVCLSFTALCLFGCGMMNMTSTDYDLYIFSGKGENASALTSAAKAFEEETGKKVKTFSLGSGTNSSDTLRAEMNSKNMPTIFSIVNIQELKEWEEGGFALDFNTVTDEKFKSFAEEIPENMRLTSDGKNSFGVPFNVEGYGYIVDTRMIEALFGTGTSESFLEDAKNATYEEFENLVKAVDAYIKNSTPATVSLNGKPYTFQSTKSELASKLTGVFAVAGSEKWTYGDHLVNVALNAVFDNSEQAASATDAQLSALKGPLTAYAKALDFKTSYAASMSGPIKRGSEFINTTTNNYDAAVQVFAKSKALFLKQGNWAYTNIEKSDKDIVKTLDFIPIKLPLKDSDITSNVKTVSKFNRSIPVFVPNYYAINAKASDEQKKTAMDFLIWLNTSEAGQKFIVEDMAFVPYNADHHNVSTDNSLSNSIIRYMKSGDVLSNPYGGAPVGWTGDVLGLEIMEKYLTKENWTDADHTAIAEYGISKWKEMKK